MSQGDEHESGGGWGGVSSWAKFLVSGLVAGLISWGSMSARMSSIEMRQTAIAEAVGADRVRATEDRLQLREATDRLTSEIGKLRDDLQAERLQRVIDKSNEPHSTFQRGLKFDK